MSKNAHIVFLGKTGNGKSSSINSLIGKRHFKSKASPESVTINCEAVLANIGGTGCLVVDTPGLCDTIKSESEIYQELTNIMKLTDPGIHIFVIVLAIGRFTLEEQKTLRSILEYFGKGIEQFCIILFTKMDDLEEENIYLKDYIKRNTILNDFVNKFGQRYIGLNNRLDFWTITMIHKRFEFINLINSTIKNNNQAYYQTELFKSSSDRFFTKKKMELENNALLAEKNKIFQKEQENLTKKLSFWEDKNQQDFNYMNRLIEKNNAKIEEKNADYTNQFDYVKSKHSKKLRKMKKKLKKKKKKSKKLKKKSEKKKKKSSSSDTSSSHSSSDSSISSWSDSDFS